MTTTQSEGIEPEDRLADFSTDFRVIILSIMAIAIGAMSALVAYALIWLISSISNLFFFQTFSSTLISPAANRLGLFVILLPVVGGIIIGFMARYGSSKIRGHGIPEALEAILIARSKIDLKVAILKPVSSAISIGSGGPFGAEGPIIMTGGAFGSLFAQFFHLSAVERKTLLVAGAAAGMSAIFNTPIAAVILAVELLLFEWKPRSFIPVAVASAVAAAARVPLLGGGAIFGVVPHAALGMNELAIAFAVGIVAGFASGLVTNLVYGFEDLFEKIPIHWMWWPAIGGLVVGIGGYIDPRVLGVGYDLIHGMLRGEILGPALIGLLIGKALVWSVALGSGTSGGVVAPLLIIGGALGAVEAHWIPWGDSGLWAMVSMAAVMAGTMGAPFTAMVFTLELTHDMNSFPALMIACIASIGVTVLLMRRSILTEKVARHGHHIFREYGVDPLALVQVSSAMDPNVRSIRADMPLVELANRITMLDSDACRHHALPIVNSKNELVGIISRGDIVRAMSVPGNESIPVIEAGQTNLITAFPDETLVTAVERMLKNDVGRLLIVNRQHPKALVGYLGRPGILQARVRTFSEEREREPGWIKRMTARA